MVIPDYVTKIDSQAFARCDSIESVTIPEGVIRIRDYAFGDCENLRDVTLSKSVSSIGCGAFSRYNKIRLPSGLKETSNEDRVWNTPFYNTDVLLYFMAKCFFRDIDLGSRGEPHEVLQRILCVATDTSKIKYPHSMLITEGVLAVRLDFELILSYGHSPDEVEEHYLTFCLIPACECGNQETMVHKAGAVGYEMYTYHTPSTLRFYDESYGEPMFLTADYTLSKHLQPFIDDICLVIIPFDSQWGDRGGSTLLQLLAEQKGRRADGIRPCGGRMVSAPTEGRRIGRTNDLQSLLNIRPCGGTVGDGGRIVSDLAAGMNSQLVRSQ
ncbi:MAG: leucine-rich repeat domain-containing protein [Clostridia bacterium]|nr:leucine-rich repeat domain-containing protein [Clostridia bacterium]